MRPELFSGNRGAEPISKSPLTVDALQQFTRSRYEQSGCGRELLDRYVGEQRDLLDTLNPTDTLKRDKVCRDRAEVHRSKGHRRHQTTRPPSLISSEPVRPPLYIDPAPSRKRPLEEFSSNSSLIQCADVDWSPSAVANRDREYITNDVEQDTEKVDGRRTKGFQKRKRHKMRAPSLAQNLGPPPEKERAKTTSKKKEVKGDARIPKNRTDALVEQFSTNNIANPRITLNPSHRLGIFKKGREAGNSHGVSDLSFNDMTFLRSKPLPSVAAYREPKPTIKPLHPKSCISDTREATNTVSLDMTSKKSPEPPAGSSDIGPMDSISQVPIRQPCQNEESADGKSDFSRSEYSRLGYQAKHLSKKTARNPHHHISESEGSYQPLDRQREPALGAMRRRADTQNSDSRSVHRERVSEPSPPRTSSALSLNLPVNRQTSPLQQLLRICDRFKKDQSSSKKTVSKPILQTQVLPGVTQNRDEIQHADAQPQQEPIFFGNYQDQMDEPSRQLREIPARGEEIYARPEIIYEALDLAPQIERYMPFRTSEEAHNDELLTDVWDAEGRDNNQYQEYRPAFMDTHSAHSGGYNTQFWNLTEQPPAPLGDDWVQGEEASALQMMPLSNYDPSIVYVDDSSSGFYAGELTELEDEGPLDGDGYNDSCIHGNRLIHECQPRQNLEDEMNYQTTQGWGGVNRDRMFSEAAFMGFWRPHRLD